MGGGPESQICPCMVTVHHFQKELWHWILSPPMGETLGECKQQKFFFGAKICTWQKISQEFFILEENFCPNCFKGKVGSKRGWRKTKRGITPKELGSAPQGDSPSQCHSQHPLPIPLCFFFQGPEGPGRPQSPEGQDLKALAGMKGLKNG